MAREFRGTNDITSAKDIWWHRANFYVNAYQGSLKETKDLSFFEQAYYGTIDHKDNSIMPKTKYLKPLTATNSPGTGMIAMDFVVDAFDDVRKSFQYACNAGLLEKSNPLMYSMEAKRAYRSPYKDYETTLSGIFLRYNTEILANHTDLNKITDFYSYVKLFLKIISRDQTRTPITMEKWCRSTSASVFHSGLAIDIGGLDIDKDQAKIDNFIDDKNFNYYKKVMLNRGFSLMEHAPWILIADLQSPAMAPYLGKYRISKFEDIFNRYNITYNINLNTIKRIIVKYYNFFAIVNSEIKDLIVCSGKTKQKYTQRNQISQASIADDYWYDLYISFRNYEEGHPFTENKIKSIKRRAKILDKNKVMGYINSRFGNQTWNKPYGYDDFARNVRKPISSVPFANESRTSSGATLTTGTSIRSSGPSGGGGGY